MGKAPISGGRIIMTTYTIPYPNGERRGIKVEMFKDTTETYVRERIEESVKYPVVIKQRLYRDGRWIFRIYTVYSPRTRGFHKRYNWFWDCPDIKALLDNVIEEYREWISSVE